METAFFSGGSQQIRTAVDGFADRYLTTRSGNQHFHTSEEVPSILELLWTVAKVQLFLKTAIIYAHFPPFWCSFSVFLFL